jgi:hypothetical protein
MKIVRCKDCVAYDPNPSIVTNNTAHRDDPDFGVCRAKLPNAAPIVGPQGPMQFTYQPRMHKNAGCCEGEEQKWI